MISHSVIIRDRHHVLGGIDTDLLHPFGVYIQAARPLLHYFGVKFLPFLTEKPIDENLHGIGMRRTFDDTENAITATCRESFFRRRHFLDRQAGIEKGFLLSTPKTDGDRELPFCESVGNLPEIAAQKQLLLHELP